MQNPEGEREMYFDKTKVAKRTGVESDQEGKVAGSRVFIGLLNPYRGIRLDLLGLTYNF